MATAKRTVQSKSTENTEIAPRTPSLPQRISRKNILIIAVFIVIALLWKFKSNLIVAMVNGQPVSRWQLDNRMMKKFGDQTLDSIINERLILAAARQKGIFINAEDIDSRIKQIEGKLNGKMTLDDALKAQGLTREDLRQQLEIQLSIEKMFEKEATVSAADIDDYIKNNSQAFKDSTDPAALKEEVKSMLSQQKINDLFGKWFDDMRKNAKVTKFL